MVPWSGERAVMSELRAVAAGVENEGPQRH